MNPRLGPAFVLMAGRGLGVAVSFLLPVALARTLDQSEFGTYRQLFLIYGTIYGIAQMGLAESLFYFLPSAPRDAGRHVANSMCGLAAAGFACLTLLWAGRDGLGRWLSNAALPDHLPLLGLFLLLMLSSSGLEIVLTARNRFGAAACAYALSDVLRTVLCLLPVLRSGRLHDLLLGAVAFGALRLGAAAVHAGREFRGDLRPDRALLRRQLAYALPFELAVLVEIVQWNYHQYAVAHTFDPATFAIYSVGCLQVPLVDLIAGSACNVAMVRMGEQRRDGRVEAMRTTWHDAVRTLAAIFVPIVGVLLVTGRDLVTLLFTDAYLASVPIFMVWTLSFLLQALPLDAVLRVFADTRALLVIGALKLVFIATTIGWFLSELHLLGAVVATLSAACVAKGLALARIKRLMGLRAADLLPWGSLAAFAGCGALAALPALLAGSLPLAAPGRLVAGGLVYAAAYGGLVHGLGIWRLPGLSRVYGWAARLASGQSGAAEGPGV
jgi:O-antigen/teichoic acid export membrane protein